MQIGHVHLRVSDLDRATGFYRDGLGLDVIADGRPAGKPAGYLAYGDYHHHVALNTFESAGGAPPPPDHAGLYHVAFLYPDREELAAAVAHLEEQGYEPDRARDHGATVSVYLDDPEGNGVELYYDRPRDQWFDEGGRPVLRNDPIDPHDLP